MLVRAATQDREMVGALGVNQALALHLGVRARRVARRPRRRAADAARAGQPGSRPGLIGDAFVVVGGRRHGLDRRRLRGGGVDRRWSRRCASRRARSTVRLAVSAQQADAGGRVPGHGGGAGVAALGPVRQAAGGVRGMARRGAAAAFADRLATRWLGGARRAGVRRGRCAPAPYLARPDDRHR